ncbi:uncharacterized protein J8A68_001262 [[Candida] subhashii]|uniref:Nucleoporin Nup120/160 beta-propeller domain-containing protein n=1 Tax=[Candida] subhashii TaxID=561895 RepID=A0A8J5UR46_9ASCO|nr:uncharacterized protein J8A68_001262 [[Candida] subhashii]KAG7665206.1 hypothetical protein J8A68_001262 [[Candida] subhashii]
MDSTSYSTSNIVGYSSNLPTRYVHLPLKYPETSSTSDGTAATGSNKKLLPNEQFQQMLSNCGDIINLTKYGLLIDFISFQVLNDLKTIILTPIISQSNNFNFQFQNIQIQLPHKIISNKCITLHFQDDNHKHEDGNLIIDLIDANYLFINLKISLSDFIISNVKKLNLLHFDKWGHISVPYSFELRSSPFYIKSLDTNNLVVSLKDGGFIHFARPTILQDFTVYNFQESTASLLPPFGGFFSGFFKPKQEIILEGISSNSIIDVVKISNDVIVALTVCKMIKVWNLSSHQNITSPLQLDNDVLNNHHDNWITSVPTKHLQLLEIYGTQYIILFFNSAASDKIDSNKSRFVFKILEIIDYSDSIELKQLDKFTFQPEIPNSLLSSTKDSDASAKDSTFQNILWFIQDFQTEFNDNVLQYHILWKSNTSSMVVTYNINFDHGTITSINLSLPEHSQDEEDLSPYHDIEYYQQKIFNSGRYDSLIIETSIEILRSHWKLGPYDGDKQEDIRQVVMETINQSCNTKENEKSFWFKLDLLCEEFKKLSQESLAISLTNKQSMLLSLQVNGFGVFRPSHYYESFANYKLTPADSQLMTILNKFRTVVSSKTYHRLHEKLLNTSTVTPEQVNELFQNHIRSRFTDEEIQSILIELENIPGILEIIKSLINLNHENGYELVDDEEAFYTNEIGSFRKLNAMNTFKAIKSKHEDLLLDLVSLFLICETNEDIISLINQTIESLNNYNIASIIFDTCFKDNSSHARIETIGLSKLENSLFWTSIVAKHPKLNKFIRQARFNEAYDYFYNDILLSHNTSSSSSCSFVVDVCIELIKRDEGLFLKKYFLNRLNKARIVDRFLMGLIFLRNGDCDEFFEIFETYTPYVDLRDDLELQNKVYTLCDGDGDNDSIKVFLDAVFSQEPDEKLREAEYFDSLCKLSQAQSKLASSQNVIIVSAPPEDEMPDISINCDAKDNKQINDDFINIALKFENKAIEILKSTNSHTEIISTYYLKVFELSLIISKYDLIYESLSNLSTVSHPKFKQLFQQFISKLVSQSKLSIICPPNPNTLYRHHFSLIDSILLELASKERYLVNSLKLYQYLYSWRLFGVGQDLDSLADKRGAIEALYMFIERFKHSKNDDDLIMGEDREDLLKCRLKVLELYMIILNCLKTFEEDDDKWIISHGSDSNRIVKIEELKIEYLEWLKQLSDSSEELLIS